MKILGIDTLEFGIDVEDYDNSFGNLLKELEEKKQSAQTDYKPQYIEINNMRFIVNKKGQGFYAYKIECEQFYICFMSRKIDKSSPIFVRFMSEFLWEHGFEGAFNKFMKWFCKQNIKVIDTRISRLDICLDTDEIAFTENDINSFITRANKIARHYIDDDYYTNKNFSGFTIGRGSKLSCRIYDKTLEIQKSKKKWFKDIWKANNWNDTRRVWRIEFQIRRKVLKELSIDSFHDIKPNLKELWGYLTQKWLVMKEKSKDKNMSRWKTHSNWLLVQNANYDSLPDISLRQIIKKGNLDTLMDSCIGAMISISVLRGTDNINDTYLSITRYMKEKNIKKGTSFQEEVKKRKKSFI